MRINFNNLLITSHPPIWENLYDGYDVNERSKQLAVYKTFWLLLKV